MAINLQLEGKQPPVTQKLEQSQFVTFAPMNTTPTVVRLSLRNATRAIKLDTLAI